MYILGLLSYILKRIARPFSYYWKLLQLVNLIKDTIRLWADHLKNIYEQIRFTICWIIKNSTKNMLI